VADLTFKLAAAQSVDKWKRLIVNIPRINRELFEVHATSQCGFCTAYKLSLVDVAFSRDSCDDCPAKHICMSEEWNRRLWDSVSHRNTHWRRSAKRMCAWVIREVENLAED